MSRIIRAADLQLSVSPTVNTTTTLEVHIIPTVKSVSCDSRFQKLTIIKINFGISALGIITANVFADVDASTTLTLDLGATETVSYANSTVSNATDPSFSGSVKLDTGVSINIGADDSFLGLFNGSTSKVLFSKDFQLFQVSLGCTLRSRRLADQSTERLWEL